MTQQEARELYYKVFDPTDLYSENAWEYIRESLSGIIDAATANEAIVCVEQLDTEYYAIKSSVILGLIRQAWKEVQLHNKETQDA